jgi:hypothetical protein
MEIAPSMSHDSAVWNDMPAEVHIAFIQMQNAMKQLPVHDTAAFATACERDMSVVLMESNPVWFVRAENGHTERAAVRLAKYWKTRVFVFEDRAFLPLRDLSGKGALRDVDIEYMSSGSIVMLPKDLEGRSVVCVDASRSARSGDVAYEVHRQRCVFYMCGYLAASNAVSQSDGGGVVVLRLLRESHADDRLCMSQVVDLLRYVFAVRASVSYVCMVKTTTSMQGGLLSSRSFGLGMFGQLSLTSSPTSSPVKTGAVGGAAAAAAGGGGR